jgi:hypothetical protein
LESFPQLAFSLHNDEQNESTRIIRRDESDTEVSVLPHHAAYAALNEREETLTGCGADADVPLSTFLRIYPSTLPYQRFQKAIPKDSTGIAMVLHVARRRPFAA